MSAAFEHSSRHDSIELLVLPESGVVFSNHPLQSNKVTTTKYTWYNFIPLNLWQQLTTLANIYFIFIGVLQSMPWTTTSNGIPTILTPLTTITVISGGRAAIENVHAAQSDEKRNSQLFWQIAAKNPQLFQNQLKLATNRKGSSSANNLPLLMLSPGDGEVDSEGKAPLRTHPQSILHTFYQLYPTLSSRVRRRWTSWETRSPSKAINLPGLELQPQQAQYAFRALQPQKQGIFSSIFKSDSSSSLFSPNSGNSLSAADSVSSPNTSNISLDDSTFQSPSSPHFNSNTSANLNAVNQRLNMLNNNSNLELVRSGDLKPGTILKVYQGQAVPADMILLGSSNTRGHCFIDKANLNGETQLEVMNSIPYLKPYFGNTGNTNNNNSGSILPGTHSSSVSLSAPNSTTSNSISQSLALQTVFENDQDRGLSSTMAIPPFYDIDLHLKYDLPNADFEQFRGVMSVFSHSKPHLQPVNISLSTKQLLLRETVLRNTDYIYGLVVYTGDDTKIRRSIVEESQKDKKSESGPQIKQSRLMNVISRLVAILFLTQIVMCLIAGISYSIWVWQNGKDHWYLDLSNNAGETLLGALFTSLSWMISLNTFVPISLLVTMEMTRFMTSIFVEWDLELYDPVIDRPTKANTSTIHDDLGKVDLICSDKTGTLTRNQQEMRYLSIAVHDGLPGLGSNFGAAAAPNGVHSLVDHQTFKSITKSSQNDLDPAQKQWRAKGTLSEIKHYVQPLKATMAFEAFGSMQTEIAAKVKSKTSKSQANLLKANVTTKDGSPLPYFRIPSSHPIAYHGLPPRWTQSLVEAGIIQPLRPVLDPSDRSPAIQKQWKLAQLMSNSYKHNNPMYQRRLGKEHKDNQPLTRKSYSLFSYLWNTAQGHAYYRWFLALQQAQGIKLAQDEADKAQAEAEEKLKPPGLMGVSSINTNHNANHHLTSSRTSSLSSRTQLATPLDLSSVQSQASNRNTSETSIHSTRQTPQQQHSGTISVGHGSPTTTTPFGSLVNLGSAGQRSNNRTPGNEMTLFAQHGAPSRLDESMAVIEPESDEPPLISTFGTSKSLHQLAANGYLNPPADNTAVIMSGSGTHSPSAPIAYPPGQKIYSRLSFEKDYYLPLTTVLGSFRGDSRTAILTALWSKNWAHLPQYQNDPIYIAPYHVRQHLFRYIRSMALSSTVKAYRKPDGTLDWQFESAEELAMTKFAASLGFYRDVHPSGEGIVLYIREYFSPDFSYVDLEPSWKKIQADGFNDVQDDTNPISNNGHMSPSGSPEHIAPSPSNTAQSIASDSSNGNHIKRHNFKKFPSKIHAESYNSLGVCGFSSARARVSVILQRSPQLSFPIHGSYTPQRSDIMPDYDTDQCLEGFWTQNQYSTYVSEYDRQFRDQSHLSFKVHPFDCTNGGSDLDHDIDPQSCFSFGQYPDCDSGLAAYFQELDTCRKNHIHVLTKGQDSTTIPLIKDIVGGVDLEPNGAELGHSTFFNSTAQTQRNPVHSSIPYTNPHHSLKAQLYEMENASLRCLVAAYSELPNAWWSQYEQLFSFVADLDVDTHLPVQNLQQVVDLIAKHPNMSPNDLATLLQEQPPNSPPPTAASPPNSLKAVEIRHLTYQTIEESASLALLGCFGMEDQLQVLVPETIRDMRRAGIRVWMITGDKLDVAKNIALACELIDPDMMASGHSSISSSQEVSSELGASMSNWGSFARFDSNLITINNPELFPLCIRQFPSSRLINITGEWLLTFRNNKTKLLLDVFTALTEYDESKNVLVEIGYLQQCLLHVGLDLTLAQLGSMFILDVSEIPTFITNVTATTTISRDRFVSALTLIGDSISDRDSIIIDIETGLKVYESLHTEHNGDASQMPPIALLVNRNAFNLMFQDDNEAEDAQYEFHEKRQAALFQQNDEYLFSGPSSPTSTKSQPLSPISKSSPHSVSPHQIQPDDDVAQGYLAPGSPVSTGSNSSSNRTYLIKEDERTRAKRTKTKDSNGQLPWLSQKFFALALFAKSVVFARAEPAMKKKMVTATKALFPTATTLAIGDGANDTDMIMAAHIGIGIAGVEGTAASNSADYAIGTFRMLHRLLLVHGLTNPRIEKIILLMFYKGSMVAICHYFYGLHSSFSGASLFVDLLYQCYNTIYTSWCVLLLIQHQPVPAPVLQNSPALYREMSSNSFTLSRFVFWLAKSLVHAFIIFYIPLLPFFFEGNDILGGSHLQYDALEHAYEGFRGRPFTLAHVSTLQICALAVLPNIIAFFLMESIQFPFFTIVLASALSIFGCVVAVSYSRWSGGDLYLDFSSLFSNPQFWLMFFLILAIPIIFEIIIHYIQYYWADYPGLMQLAKERIYLKSKESHFINKNFNKHQAQNDREGYAQLVDNPGPQSNYNPNDHSSILIGRSQSSQTVPGSPKKTQVTFGSSLTASSLHSSLSSVDTPTYNITQTPYNDTASTPENIINTHLDVQTKGCDPDPTSLFSSSLWGEAAGYGVRTTQAEEILIANPYFNPTDRMNGLTTEAEALLRKLSQHDPTDVFVPTCIELELGSRVDEPITTVVQQNEALIRLGFHSYQNDVLSRTMALKVFRLLTLLTQSQDSDQQQQQNQSSAQSRAAMQKRGAAFYKRDRFLSSMHENELQQSGPIIVSKTAKKQSLLAKASQNQQSSAPTLPSISNIVTMSTETFGLEEEDDHQGPHIAPASLIPVTSDLIPLDGPLLQTSNASLDDGDDNDPDRDILINQGILEDEDDSEPVTISTAQTLLTKVNSDHFKTQGGSQKSGKKRRK